MLSHLCFGLKENDREASCITDEKNYILLRLNYIQRWNVCQKSLKILCLHSVYSLETRKRICYFRWAPVSRKCVPCGTFLESSLYDVINAHLDLFRFQDCFFSSICIIDFFFTLNCIDFRKKTFWDMGRTWGLECFNNWYRRGSSAKMRPAGSSWVSHLSCRQGNYFHLQLIQSLRLYISCSLAPIIGQISKQ